MLPANTERILARLGEGDRVLDVGGWAAPFRPATHVLDLMHPSKDGDASRG
jgi:hypothetical protein